MGEYSLWTPIVSKQKLLEPFVNDKDSVVIVQNVFIMVGAIIVATLITTLLYWAYNREKTLFIAIMSALIFLYSLTNVIGFTIIRGALTNIFFKMYLGLSIIVCILSIVLIILFSIKASKKMRLDAGYDAGVQPAGF